MSTSVFSSCNTASRYSQSTRKQHLLFKYRSRVNIVPEYSYVTAAS